MKKLKILIITGIFPPDIGGPATYVPQIANFLAKRGHTITIFTLSESIDYAHNRKYLYHVIRLPRRTFKPWRWLRTVVKIIQLGRDADMLFVNGLAMEAALADLVLRKPMVQKSLEIWFGNERGFGAGQKSKEETLGLMAACDIFVLNSTYEGLSHVVLEAMNLGLPVVATSVGGTPEIVKEGENGRLTEPLDNKRLYKALSELIASPSDLQLLSQGAKHTSERFAIRQMIEKTEKVLWNSSHFAREKDEL